MLLTLGIDAGASTTKIVGLTASNKVIGALQVQSEDSCTALFGAIGTFLYRNHLSLETIGRIVLTGVGASGVEGNIYDIPTKRVDEFIAIGLGGSILLKKQQGLVISVGTGTAFVTVDGKTMRHIGGSGVGGGTLLGLARGLLNMRDIDAMSALAESGDLTNVDITIGDLCEKNMTSLPSEATASNFAKLERGCAPADVSHGLFNMVFQPIGTMAAFACMSTPTKDVVLVGTLAGVPLAKKIFKELGDLYHLNFLIPEQPAYSTAIGAASYLLPTGIDPER